MDIRLNLQNHLTEQLSEDFDLLKKLEDQHRLAGDPQEKSKYKNKIDILKKEIKERNLEIEQSRLNPVIESTSVLKTNKDSLELKNPKSTKQNYSKTTIDKYQNSITGKFLIKYNPPAPVNTFVGREDVIENIIKTKHDGRYILVLGISGIGKTSLLKQLADNLNKERVFWYKFKPGFTTLQNLLVYLSRFLDNLGEVNTFEEFIKNPEYLVEDKISLILNGLNSTEIFLFFDDFYLVEENSQLESFFALLKEHFDNGLIFISSLNQPNFLKLQDIAKSKVKIFALTGLNEDDVKKLLTTRKVTISDDAIQELNYYLDGMPLAYELLLNLIGKDASEQEWIDVAKDVQGRVIDHLYEALYEQLSSEEVKLLSVASLLRFGFTKSILLELSRNIYDKNFAAKFLSLRKKGLINEIGSIVFRVPGILSALVIEHNQIEIEKLCEVLPKLLIESDPDNYYVYLEAFILYAKTDNFAGMAEMVSILISRRILIFETELAEIAADKLEESKFEDEQWMWILGDKGMIASHLHQYKKAEDYWNRMLNIAISLDSKEGKALALLRLGTLYTTKDHKKAESYYNQSLKLKKELKDLNGQAEIYNNLGLVYSDKGDIELAIETLEKGLKLHEQLDHENWQFLPIYNSLLISYGRSRKWEKSDEFGKKALEIAEELNSPYDIAMALYNLSVNKLYQGKSEEAEKGILKSLKISQKNNLQDIEELACASLARIYFDNNQLDKSIDYFERVAEIFEKSNQKDSLCMTKFDTGIVYFQTGNIDKAIENHLDGINLIDYFDDENLIENYLPNIPNLISEAAEDTILLVVESLKKAKNKLCKQKPSYKLALVYETLATIYFEILAKERVALACLKQKIKFLESLEYKEELVASLMDISLIYESLEKYARALEYLNNAYNIATQEEYRELVGGILYNIGNIYAKIKDHSAAEDNYKKAKIITLEEENSNLTWMINFNLGEIYRRQGKFQEAILLLEEVLEVAREKENNGDVISVLNNLGGAYENIKEETKALTCWHEAINLAKSEKFYREEVNTLISVGNFYWYKNEFEQAKNYYEQALSVAQKYEDIDSEESAMLSLAEVHRELNTTSEIEEEFIRIAERADKLGNRENLCKFLSIAGAISLHDGNSENSAKMFEQALYLIYIRIIELYSQFNDEDDYMPPTSLEFEFVLSRMVTSVVNVIEQERKDLAEQMFILLKERFENHKFWDKENVIVNIVTENIKIILSESK